MSDPITLTVPRTVLTGIVQLSADLTDRMHELLERNTSGPVAAGQETAELETLVQMAQFGQIVSMALQTPSAA